MLYNFEFFLYRSRGKKTQTTYTQKKKENPKLLFIYFFYINKYDTDNVVDDMANDETMSTICLLTHTDIGKKTFKLYLVNDLCLYDWCWIY